MFGHRTRRAVTPRGAWGGAFLLVGILAMSTVALGGPASVAALTTRSPMTELKALEAEMGLTGAGPEPYSPSTTPAAGTTYYVTNLGSNSAPCTLAQPCRQVSEALALVAAGDTIDVANGTYLGFDVNTVLGTPSAPVRIEAPGRAAQLVPTVNRSDNRDTVHIEFSDWIVLDGFVIDNANRAGVRIDQSDNVTVSNGTFGDNDEWGIFTDFDNYTVLEHNTIYGTVVQHGIYESNSPIAPTVRWNLIYDNNDAGLQINADATQGGWGICSGADIEDNVIYDNGAGGAAGINLDGNWNTRIVNNLLYDNHATGIVSYVADGLEGPHGMTIMDNTVVMASNGRWALQIEDSTGENYVRDNILDNLNPAHGGEEFGTQDDVNDTDTDYNIESTITVDSTGNIYTLAQWQALGYEPHSLSATPAALFVNPTAGNYHLLSTAPAIGAGEALPNVTVDLNGTSRPVTGASDIGCYEYAPAGLSVSVQAAPLAGTVPLPVGFFSTVSGGTAPYSYQWSYGDGSPGSAAADPSHTYNATGKFPVELTVADTASHVVRAFLNITVSAVPPLAATAQANPVSGTVPLPVAFQGSATGGVTPYAYRWTFGDGSAPSRDADPTHTYNATGTFTAGLEVNDSAGHTAWSNVSVTVASSATALSAAATATPTSGVAPLTVVLDGSATGGTSPYTFTWDFKDGSPTTTGPSVEHVFSQPGSYAVNLSVEDASGQWAYASVAVTVAQAPLTASIHGPSTGTAGCLLSFWGNATGGSGGYVYSWDFGDGGGWSSPAGTNTTLHSFGVAGTFDVSLWVNDSQAHSAVSAPLAVNIAPGPCAGTKVPTPPPPVSGLLSDPGVWLAVGLGLLAVAVVAVLLVRRRRTRSPPQNAVPPTGTPTPEPPPGTRFP